MFIVKKIKSQKLDKNPNNNDDYKIKFYPKKNRIIKIII